MFSYTGAKGRYFTTFANHMGNLNKDDVYIEPFGGSFSLGLKLLDLGIINKAVYNELNTDIYNIVYCIKNHYNTLLFLEGLVQDELNRQYVDYHLELDVKTFYKGFILKYGFKEQEYIKCTKALLSMAVTQTNKGAYNQKVIKLNKLNSKLLQKATKKTHSLLQNVYLYNTSYEELMKIYRDTKSFWFIDPPYDYSDDRNNQFYGVDSFDQQALSNKVKQYKLKGVLTNLPTWNITLLYKDYKHAYYEHHVYGGNIFREIWIDLN